MKVTFLRNVALNAVVSYRDIPVGTVFTGKLLQQSVYLRTYQGIVDLKDPRSTWTEGVVDNYNVVEAELIIK